MAAATTTILRPLRQGAAWAGKRLWSEAGGVRRGWWWQVQVQVGGRRRLSCSPAREPHSREPFQPLCAVTGGRPRRLLQPVMPVAERPELPQRPAIEAFFHALQEAYPPLPSAPLPVVKVEEIIEQADYLYGSGETKKLYQLLIEHKASEDAEILWRLARASRDLAQLSTTSAEEKKKLVYEALEYAKKALEKNESSFAVHKWYAICTSDVGDYEGIKIKIANAYVIKEHFQKAIELNPNDATSVHLMGVWCYSFAEMPWYQSKIAAMLFATPPSSTYEEALRYFHKAEEADPNFYSKNLLLLGKTYLKLNNKKIALLWLTKARDYPAHTEEDKQVQREAVELLNSL